MQTNNQVIPELLEMTKLTAHEIGLNKEIAAQLGEKEQRRMHRTACANSWPMNSSSC